MAIPSFRRHVLRPPLYVCARCAAKARLPRYTKRSISQKYLEKTLDAEWSWKKQAQEIAAGKKQSMLSILEERGYVNSVAGGREEFDKLLTNKRIGAYVGIDPTASSLHIGHLLPYMALFWMYINGFHTVSLLGGATAKVGDPTDRMTSRERQHSGVQTANMAAMHYQLKKLWMNVEALARKHNHEKEWAWHRELVNNNAWLNRLSIMELLNVLGPGMRLGAMLSRDTVKNKMAHGDGMSFAEFTYPVLQAWDWWYMYNTKGIQVQIGGADQFGNIVAGIDAIKYISKTHPDPHVRLDTEDPLLTPMGFTVPLLTTSSGEKFGKSAGNAVWLDKELTSSFDLYGYFVRTADSDVERHLKLFTFLPMDRIQQIMQEQAQDPSKRVAQHALAQEVVELAHGEEEAKAAKSQHHYLFSRKKTLPPLQATGAQSQLDASSTSIPGKPRDAGFASPSLNPHAAQINWNNAPSANITLPESLVIGRPFSQVLYSAGLVKSRSEGHRLVASQGAYVGSAPSRVGGMPSGELKFTPVKSFSPHITKDFCVDGLLILRVGKWNVRICKIVSDEEFEKLGLDAPGWKPGRKGNMPNEEEISGTRADAVN